MKYNFMAIKSVQEIEYCIMIIRKNIYIAYDVKFKFLVKQYLTF